MAGIVAVTAFSTLHLLGWNGSHQMELFVILTAYVSRQTGRWIFWFSCRHSGRIAPPSTWVKRMCSPLSCKLATDLNTAAYRRWSSATAATVVKIVKKHNSLTQVLYGWAGGITHPDIRLSNHLINQLPTPTTC